MSPLAPHWFLPTNGPGVGTGSAGQIRQASIPYLTQVARAAEEVGFAAVLTPTGRVVRGRVADHRDAGGAHGAAGHPQRDPGRTAAFSARGRL